MTTRNQTIEQIITAYDQEMCAAARVKVMSEIASGNPPSTIDAWNRQLRRGQEYEEQRAALRRVLSRFFPTDSQLKAQFRPAAQEALKEATKQIEQGLNK